MNSASNKFESIGRYSIVHELGRGGMSAVYLAKDVKLDRNVAIKCVDRKDKETTSLAEDLRVEAKLLAQLNHPNVVQLYDVVEQGNILGLVIEFVGGDTLTHRLRQSPNRRLRLKWLAEIAEGIASAHKYGITHCDIKSDNILITVDNIAKVADFGVAKLKLEGPSDSDDQTRVDSVNGSYFSLSPEQATGQAVDPRADIFSLAVLIHQTLLSKHPFGNTNDKAALIRRVINIPFELSESSLNSLGVRLAELLSNCLSKSPEERLYSATEIAELLRGEALNSENSNQSDDTVAIVTQQPSRLRYLTTLVNNIFPSLAFMSCGVILSFILLKWFSLNGVVASDINYVALDNIKITASSDFSEDFLALIKSTLQQSTEETVLSFKQTGLVEAKELNAIEGSFSKKAKAAGVQDILVISAQCLQKKCDIKMQHRSGDRMAVTTQTNFPVASDSLIGLKNAISSQIPIMLNREKFSGSKNILALNERSYRRYLELYLNSNLGVSADQKYFSDIQLLISESPNFLPSYHLLYRLGGYLYRNTGDESYLVTTLEILEESPNFIKNDKTIRRTKVRLLLDLGRLEEAKQLFAALTEEVEDRLFLSKIESSIAYAEGDYDKLLLLDRQNATWRPSVNNLYNLATSEFFVGNHLDAKNMVEKVLALSPNDSYALALKATIEVSLGNISSAISTYERVLLNSEDSTAYSNYGLALALDGKYELAIEASKKAISIHPDDASIHHLNLADSFTLSGEYESARNNYNEVVRLLSTPETAQEYSVLSQAYAHLGDFKAGVKVLKLASKKFPNVAELDYAASIVNTLSGNYIAAVVDVIDAIDRGIAPVWFSFEWFKPLCGYSDFRKSTGEFSVSLCK